LVLMYDPKHTTAISPTMTTKMTTAINALPIKPSFESIKPLAM
jgi:hypothetical protein